MNAVVGGMDMTSLSIGSDMNLFVTDIASVEGVQSPTGDFIFYPAFREIQMTLANNKYDI